MTGNLTLEASGISISCDLTLEATLERGEFDLEEPSSVGAVSTVEWSSCTGGSIRAVLGLSWDLRYDLALGSYPEALTGLELSIRDLEVQLAVFGGFVNCLYTGDVTALAPLEQEEPEGAWLLGDLDVSDTMALVSGAFCPTTGALAGTLMLEPQQRLGPRAGKLSANLQPIPREQEDSSLILRNVAPAGSLAVNVRTLTLIATNETDRPELFTIPAESDTCANALLPSGAALACTTTVRYVGEAGSRPVAARVQIAFHNGRQERTQNVAVRAN